LTTAKVIILCVAGDDSFDASNIGEAAEVVQEVVCDDELILIKG
jgi:T-complex protein 1 subunit alpha